MAYKILPPKRMGFVRAKEICDAYYGHKKAWGSWRAATVYEIVDGKKRKIIAHRITLKVEFPIDEKHFASGEREVLVPVSDAATKKEVEEVGRKLLKKLRGKWVCDRVICDTKEEAVRNSAGYDFLVKQIPGDFLELSMEEVREAWAAIEDYKVAEGYE